MKNVVVDKTDLQKIAPFFKTAIGKKVLAPMMKYCYVNQVNDLYARCCHLQGYQFANALLDDLQITLKINNPELLTQIPKGTFVTVSNHPLGGVDGISLIAFLGSLRPDFKVMVNSVLTYIEAMSPNFIAVEPYTSKKGSNVNIRGIKDALSHLQQGHPIGFFPAGGVSKIHINLRFEDSPWAYNIIRLIRQMHVPVVPIYFHGHNSPFFYFLGMFSWKIRSLRLPREVFLSKGKDIHITIGEPISVEEQDKYPTITDLGYFLRKKTYQCGRAYRK